MKITHHWMREFAPLGAPSTEVARQLTLAGLEVEALTAAAPPFTGVVVGQVLACGKHPDAAKLALCQVTTDGTNRLQIICGAPNVRAGMKVAVAMVGAHLPGNVSIKRAKLRGLESFGMLCSARELGLGVEHDGILELPENFVLNTDVRAALDLDDTTIEVNATPNRGDCMSVFGIARDYVAAHERRYLTYTGRAVPQRIDAIHPVAIESAACPVFTCRVIRGVDAHAQSPLWLRERLRRVGINSISPVVDVTNYVMTELGQPMHAYDLGRLQGCVRVRLGRDGERITLLNDQNYALGPRHLVIADDSGPIGLAGIMGGRDTAISAATTDVLLEAAHFVPDAITGRARAMGLFTDAAQRFERGVDPSLPPLAMERATALLLDIAGGSPGPTRSAVVNLDQGVSETACWVELRRTRLRKVLGVAVPDDEVAALLQAITDQVVATQDGWRVRTPPHRFDVRIEADLIEEVARLRGFDSIAERPALAPQNAGRASEESVAAERVLTAMADRGYREVITYSFVDPAIQRQLFPGVPALALTNAISADLSEMRVSLWVGLSQAARENLRRQQPRVRLFEMGKKFDLQSGALREVETLAGIATGARWPEQWGSAREPLDFYDVKGDLLTLLKLTGEVESIVFEAASLDCLRPGRTARISRGKEAIGWLGELHPQLAKSIGLPANSFFFELEMEAAFASKQLTFKGISRFPSVRRDLAIVIDESVPLAALQENVTVSASGLLSELRVFDVYRGPGVETGRKSIALSLILQDSSRTLTDVDADSVVTSVVTRLRDVLSATIRDQ